MAQKDRIIARNSLNRRIPQRLLVRTTFLLSLVLAVPAQAHDAALPHLHVDADQSVSVLPSLSVLAVTASMLVFSWIAYRSLSKTEK